MTQFDSRLRRALMDANLAQYQRTLQGAEIKDPAFTPGYLRERMRLLADPQGWGHRWGRPGGQRRRLSWQLIAILAALLLLSACAYAVVTGQFSQWFPRRGVDPKAPETSEEVLSGTGTVIGQSVTLGDETVTLNAALWDGSRVWISMELESPRIPEEIRPHTLIGAGACSLSLRQDQWEVYTRNRWEQFYADTEPDMPPERLEAEIRARLEEEDPIRGPHFEVLAQGENTLTLESTSPLFAELFPAEEQPELTLRLENLAVSMDGEEGSSQETVILKGPFTFTFTLDRPALTLSIRYDAAGAELPAPEVPFRFTGFELSTTGLTAAYTAQDPKNLPGPGEVLALIDSLRGLWTEDGTYVELTGDGSGTDTSVTHDYPYPIDPAAVTALDVCGVRVELSGLERLDG